MTDKDAIVHFSLHHLAFELQLGLWGLIFVSLGVPNFLLICCILPINVPTISGMMALWVLSSLLGSLTGLVLLGLSFFEHFCAHTGLLHYGRSLRAWCLLKVITAHIPQGSFSKDEAQAASRHQAMEGLTMLAPLLRWMPSMRYEKTDQWHALYHHHHLLAIAPWHASRWRRFWVQRFTL